MDQAGNRPNDSLTPDKVRRLKDLAGEAAKASPESLKLPLPRRFTLPVVQEYLDLFLGNALPTIDTLIQEEAPSVELFRILNVETSYGEMLKGRGINRQALEQMLQMRRFQLNSGPIFTFRDSLCARLDDMDIGATVPMVFLRPPYPYCYFEYGPAETRGITGYQVFAHGQPLILEGIYISFFESIDHGNLTDRGREVLGIDPEAPLRCMELSFTGSPISEKARARSVLADDGSYLSLMWTDDDRSIVDTLEAHFNLLRGTADVSPEMEASIRDNVTRLAKCMLYLGTGNREQTKESPQSELEARLASIKSAAKVKKVKRQIDRTYDRIVIGPNRPYKPLDKALQGVEGRTGVKPHFRRAHWSTRWYGKGKKQLKPVQIGLKLVNAKGLSEEETGALMRDYDVK